MDVRVFESKLLSAATGIATDVERLWQAGERIWNLRRAIMVLREDRHRADDTISRIWFEAKNDAWGGSLSEPLDGDRWDALKDRYYQLRGWNATNGRPARGKLEELGMKGVAEELQSAGKIG
jgi:aldehyde:ferredoxin oxidoreductase